MRNIRQNVVLLACPWIFQQEPEFQSQQLGLAYIGSFIEEHGHNILKYIDPMLYGGESVKKQIETKYQKIFRVGHPDSWIANEIPDETNWIFINAPFTDSRFVLYPLCNLIKKKYPEKKIVVGGVLATTLSLEIMHKTSVDIVVKGEGEITAAKILNGENLDLIPGIAYRKNGRIYENKNHSEQVLDINNIPWITKHNFRPMDQYARWSPRGNKIDKTFSYVSSRGCPFKCEFCSIPEKSQHWRPFSPERVKSEIKLMIEKYGITHIEIEDDNFTLKSKHSLSILKYIKELRKQGYPIACSFPNGIMIDRLDRKHIFAIKDAGTYIAYLPIESGDLKNLIIMNKPMALKHLDKSLQVAKWCYEANLKVGTFFILGYPGGRVFDKKLKDVAYKNYKNSILEKDENSLWMSGEDKNSFDKTIEFIKKLRSIGVNSISPLIATPYPGTSLYKICEKFGWFRYEDLSSMVTTVSYQNFKEEFINIETPWCTVKELYERWKYITSEFPIQHNVIKE